MVPRHSVNSASTSNGGPSNCDHSQPAAVGSASPSSPDREFVSKPSPASLRVVAIGGGTGLSTLLRGLRRHVSFPDWPAGVTSQISDLAAVVTVTDDGGSSGR